MGDEKSHIWHTGIEEEFGISLKDITHHTESDLQHSHNFYEIDLFIHADLRIFLKDKQYEVSDGDLFFINNSEIHKIIYSANTKYSRYVLNFSDFFMMDVLKALQVDFLIENLNNGSRRMKTTVKQQMDLQNIYKTILSKASEHKRSPRKQEHLAQLKMSIVELLIYANHLLQNTMDSMLSPKPDIQVQNIIAYLDTNYMNSLTLDLLSKKFYLSPYYISRTFKMVTGVSLVEYLQHRRVIEAQKKLSQSTQSIIDVSLDCGFNNIQHFCRVFKRIAKATPSDYRKNTI